MSSFAMLALDMDSIPLRSGKTISARTLDVLEACRKAGVRLAGGTSAVKKVSTQKPGKEHTCTSMLLPF